MNAIVGLHMVGIVGPFLSKSVDNNNQSTYGMQTYNHDIYIHA